jgi:hypothetical protein
VFWFLHCVSLSCAQFNEQRISITASYGRHLPVTVSLPNSDLISRTEMAFTGVEIGYAHKFGSKHIGIRAGILWTRPKLMLTSSAPPFTIKSDFPFSWHQTRHSPFMNETTFVGIDIIVPLIMIGLPRTTEFNISPSLLFKSTSLRYNLDTLYSLQPAPKYIGTSLDYGGRSYLMISAGVTQSFKLYKKHAFSAGLHMNITIGDVFRSRVFYKDPIVELLYAKRSHLSMLMLKATYTLRFRGPNKIEN